MKRLIHDVPKWSVFLHRDARELPSALAVDPPLRQIEDELFERLYSGGAEPLADAETDTRFGAWARSVHQQCDALPDFARLANEVRGDAFMAALAVETLVEQLRPDESLENQNLRRQVSSGCTKAGDAVESARDLLDGLAGTGIGNAAGADSKAGRAALRRLKDDARLQRIAKMAGRFKRLASGRLRDRVKHAVGEVCDIERGDDLARLLPTELGRLVHPSFRMAMMRDLHEKNAMQYAMRGSAHVGRGPLVVCVDKSGSMEGDRDVWATAVTLALLEIAQRERRAYGLLAFESAVKFRAVVHPGGALPFDALTAHCQGGTNISGVLAEALNLIRTEKRSMRKADVVIISDGESYPDGAAALREHAKALGVSSFGLAIHMPAANLQPWCDEVKAITNLDDLDVNVVDHLVAE